MSTKPEPQVGEKRPASQEGDEDPSRESKLPKLEPRDNRLNHSAPGDAPQTHKDLADEQKYPADGPKKKVGVYVGYLGTGYQGLQKHRKDTLDPEGMTLEGDIERALFKAGAISVANYGNLHKVGFQRAGRTDKGVHAISNLLTLKVHLGVSEEELTKRINEFLPAQIKVFRIGKCVKSFSSYQNAEARWYEYVVPTYVFADLEPKPEEEDIPPFGRRLRACGYKITPEVRERVQKLMNNYLGTKKYHNFTKGHTFKDTRVSRHMKEINVLEPMTVGEIELLPIRIHGQSFMIHQIRKMVGTMIMVMRGHFREDVYDIAFSDRMMPLPVAPGNGLMLDSVVYSNYDRKWGGKNGNAFMSFPDCEAERMKFKHEMIYPEIAKNERKTHHVAAFLWNNAKTWDNDWTDRITGVTYRSSANIPNMILEEIRTGKAVPSKEPGSKASTEAPQPKTAPVEESTVMPNQAVPVAVATKGSTGQVPDKTESTGVTDGSAE